MTTITYSADQIRQRDDLVNFIQDYCESNGIDPNIYISQLDSTTSIDPALLNDPVFQAYWQLAYLKLMEIINPMLVQSLYAELGEVNFDTLYARAGDDLNQFITNLVSDNPEFMAFAALSDGDAATSADAVFALLEGQATLDSMEYRDEQARQMAEEFGLGGLYDYLIGTEEGIKTTENHLFDYLAELDQQLVDLADALSSGELSPEAFQAQQQAVSATRQIIVGMLQNLEQAWQNLLQMYSELVRAETEGQQAIASRVGQVN